MLLQAGFKTYLPCAMLLLAGMSSGQVETDSPAAAAARMGERLFLETRFAEFFFANSGGDANFQLPAGDPVMNETQTLYGPVTGPFAGQSMNCRACHLVDEFNSSPGNRTYCDFTTRSPIPRLAGDDRTNTPRNSPTLVNALLPRATPLFLHFDGQFASPHDLILGTLTGRNYGWKPNEYATAIAHIAHIIRGDDGSNEIAQSKFGGGYPYNYVISPNSDHEITKVYRLDFQYTLGNITITNPADPGYVTDEEIVEDVIALIQVYLETLVFQQDPNGNFTGSPFDVFLVRNGLPQQPDPGETPLQYSQRLLALIEALPNPQFVTDPADGHFTTHDQSFQFGPTELAGLKIFFDQGKEPPAGKARPGRTGNCVACHAPPAFTDFVFHNTGAAQEEYDAIHGPGAFERLQIPNLAERDCHFDAYLPQTTNHPNATGRFITPPAKSKPGAVDLGLWNVFANPDLPASQAGLQQVLLGLVPTARPHIHDAATLGCRFGFRVSGGAPGWTYTVLTSGDMSLQQAEWNTASTFTFGADGSFTFTNAVAPGKPQAYFALAAVAAPAAEILPLTIARFKTPTVRDLGHSQPYLHTGRKSSLEDVVRFYRTFSEFSRAGLVRNADPELRAVSLDNQAIAPLSAFLRALNEDYTD